MVKKVKEQVAGETLTLNWTQIKCIADREVKIDELQTLAATIREVGLINPITLIKMDPPAGDKLYEVIAGRRRFKAMVDVLNQGSFVEGVDFRVMPENCDTASISLVENFERKNLTLAEEVACISNMMKSINPLNIAKLLGRTSAWVMLRANLSKLSDNWKKCMEDNANPTMSVGHYEIIARMPADRQEHLWEDEGQYLGDMGTVQEFKKMIEDQEMLRLPSAPFDTNTCGKCLKRSQANMYLFEDLQDFDQDRCLDLDCYNKKLAKHIEQHKKKIADANAKGANIYLISNSYSDDAGILRRRDYEKIEDSKEPNAFIVGGSGAGTYCTIKLNKTANTSASSATPTVKKEKTMADRDAELLHKREKLAIEKLIKHLRESKDYISPTLETMFRMSACLGVAPLEYSMYGLSGYNEVLKMKESALLGKYWKRLLENICGNLFQDISGTLEQIRTERAGIICDIVEIVWNDFLNDATDEIKEPKSWAALRAAEDKNNNKEQE